HPSSTLSPYTTLFRSTLGQRVGRHHGHHRLADIGSLPLLGEVVPDVLAVDGPVAAGPGPDQIWPERDGTLDEQRPPVVPDQVDGLADALELRDEPVDV